MVLFVHGLGQNSVSWESTLESLDESIPTDCPDLFSFIEQGKGLTYSELYRAFVDYCSATYTEPIHLCGLSLGGILSLQYAIEYPEKVRTLVLIGTQYTIPKKVFSLQNFIFRFFPNKMFLSLGITKKDFFTLTSSMKNLDFSQSLEGISCKTLILCGDNDKVTKKASIHMDATIPHSTLRWVEGSGHVVNLDAPELLGEILNQFYLEN